MAATFSHLLLWNRDDLRLAWSWASPSSIKKMLSHFNLKFWEDSGMRDADDEAETDPHFREMLKVSISPNLCYASTLISYSVVS